ncbi:MAG: energy transducer TonB [Pseudomonadota bacterium]|nr:energy transducer TonB [Pseudomonadota bacterium]
MYSGHLSPRDRVGPAVAVVLVHLALGAMLLGMSGHLTPAAIDSAMKVIDLSAPPPPPPVEPPPPPPKPKDNPRPSSAKPKAAAPPAKKAEATPIVLPRPKIIIPVPSPVAVAPKAGQGTAPAQGAAAAGTGSGAGGLGNGTGGGGNGNGSGGGGDDGTGTHPRPLFRPLNPRGFPRALVEPLPPGARVLIIFTVELNGKISGCSVRQPSGSPELDALVCQVATERFRYEPARHADGRPYVAKSAYMQVF